MQYVKISLPTWRKIERLLKEVDRLGFGSIQTNLNSNTDTVLIRNDTDDVCERFHMMQISNVVVTPDDSLVDFQQRPVFTGITPSNDTTTENKLVVCAEPIESGRIGRAWADGVVMTQINVTDESHNCATIKPNDTTQLQSSESGLCYILWKESGTGTKWAVVRIGSQGSSIRKAYCKTDAGSGSTITCYLDTDGTGEVITVNCTISGGSDLEDAFPTLEDGNMLPVFQSDSEWYACTVFTAAEDC